MAGPSEAVKNLARHLILAPTGPDGLYYLYFLYTGYITVENGRKLSQLQVTVSPFGNPQTFAPQNCIVTVGKY